MKMYLILTFVSLLSLCYFIKRRILFRKLKGFGGPKGWPIIGNFLDVKDPEMVLQHAYEYPIKYGKNCMIFVGNEILIFTSDTKLIEKIMGSQNIIVKSKEYTFIKRWLGTGLLTSTGTKWKSRRKVLTPAFHYNILQDFIEIFEAQGKQLIKNLEANLGNDSVDIKQIFSYYTLDVICESSMGTAIDVQNNPNHEYFKAINEMVHIFYLRTTRPQYRYDTLYELFSVYRHELKIVKIIKDFSLNIIRKRRDVLNNLATVEDDVDEFGKRKKSSFLDILLRSKIDEKPLNDEDIREEVDTFLFEGYDTTSIALSFIAYNLANNPHVQDKVVQEIKDVFGSRDKKVNIEDLNELKYLEMTIKESLRLYPSVPVYGRKVEEDFEYEGSIIPKGTSLMINAWSLHRDEKLFPDPFKFDPERFEPKNRSYGPYEYIPFSAGPRNCIGQKFAMLEMKSAISKLLWHFELKPAEPKFTPRVFPALTLNSYNGICVRLEKRCL